MNKISKSIPLSNELAYIIGFLCGDGCICIRPQKHEYSIYFTGNLKDEIDFYLKFLKPMIKQVFGIEPKVKIQKSNNTINLIIYSKELVNFIVKKFDLYIGKKSEKVTIPKVIKRNENLTISFLRGFADADFSLYLKKRYKDIPYYPVIVGSSKSHELITEFSKILQKLKINHYIYTRDSTFVRRIEINGKKNVEKWMESIGFKNNKYIEIFQKIKEL